MNISQDIKKAKITVDKEVVKHLSLGLYRNFALAIKELISNSYDAGATEVKLKLDLENGRIILRDNGRGMSETEFKNQYLRIGYFKEPSKDVDELGRMRIGTFGIGFLAPLPYCKSLKIITKKNGNKFAVEGNIKAENFFKKGNWDIKDEEVEYTVYESDLSIDEGETIIILENIKEQIYDELSRETKVTRSIEGSGYDKFKWTLAQYCPIEFPPSRKDLIDFFGIKSRVSMKLWLDGIQIYRNIPLNTNILEKKIIEFGGIKVKYLIMTPFETVKPEEMRGLQVRLKDVAIGFPRDFDVTKLGRVLGKLNQLCGEVHIQKGLDNSLLVNRDSFNYTEDVAKMYDFFRERLTYWNERLHDWANDDKELYLALGELSNDERILDSLSESNLLHFSKERLRLSEGTLRKSKSKTVEDSVDRVVDVLSKKAGESKKIIRRKGVISPNSPAIEINNKLNTITIFEDHSAFVERIEFDRQDYRIQYDEWDPSKTPFSICQLSKNGKNVVYNKNHPLFKGKLNDNIVKRLGLGILIILSEVKNKEDLIRKFNNLIEDTFSEK